MKCKLCQSKDVKIIRNTLRHNIKRNVLQCDSCGFVFLDPIENNNKQYYASKEYRKSYGPIINKESNAEEIFNINLPFQQPIVDEISHIIKPNFKVLDVGCATGHFLHSLKGKVKTRVGLELNQEHVTFINKRLGFKVYSEPIEEVSIKEGPFDLITCLQVLEHIDDPASFLKAIAKNLKSDGYLYLELPNIDDILLSYYEVEGYRGFYFREPHVSYFSIKTLKILLDKAGFKGEVKTIQRYNILNHINWLLSGKPQDSYAVGNSEPALVKSNKVNKRIKKDFNDFIKLIDLKYKKLLTKYNLGENLSFLGKKI